MPGTFKFHSVGQGLCYSGTITQNAHSINFVYDCGSKNEKSSTRALQNTIKKLPRTIDFLVVSHLHEDHISGIPLFLQRPNANIKKIYLPYFDARTFRNVFIAYLISGSIIPTSPMFQYLVNWYDCDFNYEGISSERGEIHDANVEIEFVNGYTSNMLNDWTFLFFNKMVNQNKINAFNKSLQLLLNGQTIEQYIIQQNGNYSLLSNQFNMIFKNLNLTSLLLLHFNSTQKTLLTGDIESDRNLNSRLQQYINEGDQVIMQTPHHGAKKAWNAFSCTFKYHSLQVISFGLGNRYGHPSQFVVDDFLKNKVRSKLVTQLTHYSYKIP